MTAVKERPILFSAPMVRAILEGRKTVTRRAVAAQPPEGHKWRGWVVDSTNSKVVGTASWAEGEGALVRNSVYARCPYGPPGNRLWVREDWAADAQLDSISPRDLSRGEPIWYPADGGTRQPGCAMISKGRGRPSIHMPRWACRILLEVSAVRVERLQDITYEEAVAEGVYRESEVWMASDESYIGHQYPVPAFRDLWSEINGDESWDSNPWVWVVEFKQVTKPCA